MKLDLYTQTVLTVIAVCLIWLCVNSLTPSASAQADVQKVMIVDARGLPQIGPAGLRVNLGDSVVPIALANPDKAVPVAIRAIERAGTGPWQPVQVDVVKSPPTQFPGP